VEFPLSEDEIQNYFLRKTKSGGNFLSFAIKNQNLDQKLIFNFFKEKFSKKILKIL
jgi:hypothetical protein